MRTARRSGSSRATPGRAARQAWLGIDLGTQSVRAVLVDTDGAVLGSAAEPLTSTRWPDGRHEQDPRHWWEAVAVATRRALMAAGDVEVAALACCATSGTIALVRETDSDPAEPVTPGLMYDDGRAVDQARLVADDPAPVWRAAGLTPQRSWALPKALWLLRDGDPGPGVRLAHQADVITSRLIGKPAPTDTSHALKSGADPVQGAWPTADLARLGLDPRLLPPLVRPGTVLGEVCPVAAEQTGLPVGVPVVAGMTDGCAAQIASGVLRPGQWSFVVGTTTVLKGVSDTLLADPSGALYSHRAPDGRWWPGGASSAGAGVLSQEFDGTDLAALEHEAAGREPAASVTYPLAGVGERFPFLRPDATGVSWGNDRDRVDRFAAVLQGVAFVERLCLDHLRGLGAAVDGPVTLSGGATRSPYWTQLQADILGRPVAVPEVAEGAVGMAVLAAASVSGDPGARLAATAERMLGPVRVVEPRHGAHDRFDDAYAELVRGLAELGWIDAALADTALAGAA